MTRTIDLEVGKVIVTAPFGKRYFVLKNRGINALVEGLDDEVFSSRFCLEELDVPYEVRDALTSELLEIVKRETEIRYEHY